MLQKGFLCFPRNSSNKIDIRICRCKKNITFLLTTDTKIMKVKQYFWQFIKNHSHFCHESYWLLGVCWASTLLGMYLGAALAQICSDPRLDTLQVWRCWDLLSDLRLQVLLTGKMKGMLLGDWQKDQWWEKKSWGLRWDKKLMD